MDPISPEAQRRKALIDLEAELTAWRRQHPTATLQEIEQALDSRLAHVHAELLNELAQASPAADWRQAPPAEHPVCPDCGTRLQPRGRHARQIKTQGDQTMMIERQYGVCPACGTGVFPLDDHLARLPGHLTPQLHEGVVRLAAWMPFAQAAELLAMFTGVRLSPATVRRQTEAAGAVAVALATAEVDRILREYPASAPGPSRLVFSADGAMVPLRHGECAEVRTLAIGEPPMPDLDGDVHMHTRSYCSRLTDAETCGRLALSESYRRGVLTAPAVAAVMDGAEWVQGFIDLHCDRAVRILDFAHAAQRIAEIGQAVWGEGSLEAQQWTTAQVPTLKHTGPTPVLAVLETLRAQQPELEVLATNLAYLKKRGTQMDYPRFQAAGWPIGSGMVESGNKLVVAARLKGAGMHWTREQVNPMLALRNLVWSDRWQVGWPAVRAALRPAAGLRRRKRLQRVEAATRQQQIAQVRALLSNMPPKTMPGTCRPTVNHPWKRPFSPRARQHAQMMSPDAKL